MKSLSILLAVGFVASTLYACGSKPPPPPADPVTEVDTDAGAEDAEPPAPATAFEKLGKREGLTTLVDSFLKNATVDPAAKGLFSKWKGERLEELKTILVDHLCKGTGGDCTPSEVQGSALKVTDKQFDALKADLAAAMAEKEVEDALQGEVTKAFEEIREPFAIVLNQKK